MGDLLQKTVCGESRGDTGGPLLDSLLLLGGVRANIAADGGGGGGGRRGGGGGGGGGGDCVSVKAYEPFEPFEPFEGVSEAT